MIDCHAFTVRSSTRGNNHILDLTDDIQEGIRSSGLLSGQGVAMVSGSTAALTATEFEPGLVERDLAAALEALAPRDGFYLHEETWGDDNGHSHVRASLIGPSIAFPVIEGSIPLGTWQQIILMDFDTRPRTREVFVNLVGKFGG
jgi:secondary thiamine-phosphate synthase enzyme